jgi:CTP synthase (UTP-ammonia lyase)
MSRCFRVALIGDHNPEVTAHRAIPIALELAATALECSVEPVWHHTARLTDIPRQLANFHGFWCVPASPYVNMEAALAAIRYARENDIPFLGTCGGFQHALIEYARNVRGLTAADHAETNPDAAVALITPLSCSLVEASEDLIVAEDSIPHRAYGTRTITESYRCNYGLNPAFADALLDTKITPVIHDATGQIRGFELRSHRFFVGTLFQPERRALTGAIPPLARAFVEAITLRWPTQASFA